MANFSSYDSSSVSMLFSSVNQNSNAFSGLYGSLSDYRSLQTGSYGKMLRSYYKIVEKEVEGDKSNKTDKKTEGNKDKVKKSTALSSDTTKVLAAVEEKADALTKTAKELYSRNGSSVFDKNKTGKADETAVYNKVGDFIENYNDLLASAEKSSVSNINNSVKTMQLLTSQNAAALKEIGITVDDKTKTLSMNAESFKAADMGKIKDLFYGTGSYGYGVATQAAMTNSYAHAEAQKANTYTSAGTYSANFNTGDLLSALF